MNARKCRELATAVGAALVLVTVMGREARAEKLYTERPAELRSSPGDDSQVVRRVGKGRSLEVVKRLGTWVQVEYEGRTGWIRRTALSTEPVSGGSADADDDKKDSKDKKKKVADADEESGDESETKAAAAGAKRNAAKKKADRRKSRKSRHDADKGDDEAEDEDGDTAAKSKSKKKAADEDADDEEMKPRRPRSTWGARGLPGGPLKVEIQAISVQAFEEPTGRGRVVFTAAEGDRVRVIARGKDRWLLIENGKKRTGWIPAVAVRDHGLLLDARKDAKADEDEAEPEETVARSKKSKKADEDEEEEVKETKTAAASDADDEGEVEEDEVSEDKDDDSRKSDSDSPDASLGASATDDDITGPPKPWSFTGSVRGGFTAVGMDVAPDAGSASTATYSGPTAGLTGDFVYHLNPKLGILAGLTYDWAYALGGLSYTTGTDKLEGINLQNHRIGVNTGVSYGKQAVGSLRVGYQYAVLNVSDIANEAQLPRESTSGPTAGLGFSYARIAGTKVGGSLGVDALLFGTRSQTEGLQDGAELGSLTSLWGTAQVDYPLGKNLVLGGGYRYGYSKAAWTGASDRVDGAMKTDRKDQSHEVSVGVGWRL